MRRRKDRGRGRADGASGRQRRPPGRWSSPRSRWRSQPEPGRPRAGRAWPPCRPVTNEERGSPRPSRTRCSSPSRPATCRSRSSWGRCGGAGDAPPETGPGQTERTTIRTRSGAVIRIDDTAAPKHHDRHRRRRVGQHRAPVGITIASSGKVTVTATSVEVTGSLVDVNTGMARFSGVLKCDTLVANRSSPPATHQVPATSGSQRTCRRAVGAGDDERRSARPLRPGRACLGARCPRSVPSPP